MYHDQDFSVLEHILSEAPFVVDVGANRGQSIRSIKTARPNAIVRSFEPNPEFSEILHAACENYENVEVYIQGLGRTKDTITFHIPVIGGVRYLEETTMRLESLQEPWVVKRFEERGGPVEFERFQAPIGVGDEFGFAPELIKIDVEGVESEVVAGFFETIKAHSPILLIENGDWKRLHPLIDSLGYMPMMPNEAYDGLTTYSGEHANTFYVKPPAELA